MGKARVGIHFVQVFGRDEAAFDKAMMELQLNTMALGHESEDVFISGFNREWIDPADTDVDADE